MEKDCREPCATRRGGINKPGTDVDAGLPNIKGTVEKKNNEALFWKNMSKEASTFSGALSGKTSTKYGISGVPTPQGYDALYSLTIDASKSNAIYGASDTVQPPAHIVTFWKRIE